MPVLFELENPIPQEVADSKELSETIEKYKLVPYGSDTRTAPDIVHLLGI